MDMLLKSGADELDIPPSLYADAEEKYEAVGSWLGADGSLLQAVQPVISPQGSIAIGTAVKPLERDEFDIDLLCLLLWPEATAVALKRAVGVRLRESKIYQRMLEEKNRCWRLNYAGQFHMDVLPAIPDTVRGGDAILVPDKELRILKPSNPKGYEVWFFDRAAQAVIVKEGLRADVQPLPAAPSDRNKWPLQVVVQILKRHRDIMFGEDERAPISIIITTLAAHAYQGELSVYEAVQNVLNRMVLYIEEGVNGEAVISNPTDRAENFADKWQSHPERRASFYQWLGRAKQDFADLNMRNLGELNQPLETIFGERVARSALIKYGEQMQSQRDQGIPIAAGTGTLASPSVKAKVAPKHTFYGSR
ncbi:MAG: nucleotidyltransferase [Parvibaculaceae bacterium]